MNTGPNGTNGQAGQDYSQAEETAEDLHKEAGGVRQ